MCKSRNGNNHALGSLVYSLALFFYLSKSRSTAKKTKSKRMEIKVKG